MPFQGNMNIVRQITNTPPHSHTHTQKILPEVKVAGEINVLEDPYISEIINKTDVNVKSTQ